MYNLLLSGTPTANEALISALTSLGSQLTGMIITVLPIALGVVGTIMAVKFGIRFFRSLVGR